MGDDPPGTIALIEERVSFSWGGRFALVMIVLGNVVAFVVFVISLDPLIDVPNVLIWVGWNVLWGFGAVIGRKRSYVVRQPVQATEEIPPSPKRSWRKTRAAFQ
jgi:hypothetical protein